MCISVEVSGTLRSVVIIGCLGAMALAAPVEAAQAREDVEFFEKNVRPVLVEHCYKCHSAQSEKLKGELKLDSRDAMLHGGKTGPAIVPAKADESLLIKAIGYADSELQMPPKYQLPAQTATDLKRWVEMGAPWPAKATVATTETAIDRKPASADHWAFQPVRPQSPPTVRDGAWARNEIDRFILAKLESKGLAPAAPADKRTLIRRAYFDLIGLPPEPVEVEAFVRNDSANAFAEVVDHLLASPHYGERWGRYWLDLARYADTNGMDENYAYPDAWRYRDYVVGAFNDDKPYDRFVTEQLAGDLLGPAGSSEREEQGKLVATGFLVVGPKMLAEQDKPKLVMDVVDEQIDVTGQTFLGLTLGCARCHDHKFDPVPAADYYALAGIFKSTRTMANLGFVSEFNERELGDARFTAEKLKHEARVAGVKAEFNKLAERNAAELPWLLRRWAVEFALYGNTAGYKAPIKSESIYPVVELKQLTELRGQLAELEKVKPLPPKAMAVAEGTPQNVPIHLRGSHLTLAKEATPRGFVKILDRCVIPPTISSSHSGRLELARWITDPANPLTARVMVNRIWQGHFGVGLVASSSNFGLRGAPPSHPELLDWLAGEFVRRGWSIKQMHRLIMLSSAYQMNSGSDSRAAELDPENHLLWRQNRRRLEAEPIRDALLSMGGNLDGAIGGSLAMPSKEKYTAIKDADPVFNSTRRAIYLPIVRSRMYDLFTIFDYVDAGVHTPVRSVTTVPQQALFMLNSELVAKEADLLAKRLLAMDVKGDAGRMRRAYELLYARPPAAAESGRAMAYIASYSGDQKVGGDVRRLAAWTSLCRVLLAANEFVYVN